MLGKSEVLYENLVSLPLCLLYIDPVCTGLGLVLGLSERLVSNCLSCVMAVEMVKDHIYFGTCFC